MYFFSKIYVYILNVIVTTYLPTEWIGNLASKVTVCRPVLVLLQM